MGVEGIGASVVRKEDRRFITGKGRYVDDIKLVGMTHAHFVRSPHAHAKVKSIDIVGGEENAGRGRGADRTADRRRQGRQSDLRLGHHLQGRHRHEDGRMAGDGAGDRALCRTGGRGGDRRDQEPGQGRGGSRRRRLRGTAGRGRYPRRDQAGRAAAASGSAGQRDLRLDHRRRGRDRRGVQGGGQRGLARHHQQPAGAECDGAARGDRRIQRRRGAFHPLHDVAESACRAPGAVGVLQHRAGAQAAGGGARCRRRLRLQDLHLSRGDGGAVGLQEGAAPGEVDRRPLRGLPHRRPWPRSPDQGRDGVRQGQQDHRAAGEDLRQSRRLYVAVLVLGADLSLRDAAVGPVQHSQHLRRGDQRLHQHHPGRRLSRRRPARSQFRGRTADGNRGAAIEGRSGGIAPQEFHHHLPASDAGDHGL